MLGLGMAFIKGMFGQVSETFEQRVAEEPEPETPSIKNTISLSRGHVITRSDEVEVLKVALFNPTNESWTDAKPDVTCTNGPSVTTKSNQKTIESNSAKSYSMSVKPSGSPDTYLCELTISTTAGDASSYQEDMTIEIRS